MNINKKANGMPGYHLPGEVPRDPSDGSQITQRAF